MQTKIRNNSDSRPPVAIGHVELFVTNVEQAVDYFVNLGMRHIHHDDDFVVLELRGGTHLVLETPENGVPISPEQTPPFDFIVDDLTGTRKRYVELGMNPSDIESVRIHSNFYLTGPDGYRIRVTSSHTSGKTV